MADPSLEEDGILREWAPLTHLLQQIPLKAQRGLFTHDLNLTCVDTLPEFIAVGTNLGLVYWYNRKKGDLQRLRCENTGSAITCVKVISTVDFMVAAGNDQGIVTVFQIPKIPPDSLPESMKPKKNKQVERYTISGLHSSSVTAIEWSMNGMKLFSGDRNGIVVLTEIDFYMHLSKSVELLNEKYEIVQLSYSQQLLLVSTLYRSIVCCHREDRWKVAQVGQKERKTLGRLGATFCLGSGRPQELVVYASRPGLRVWLADKNGVVQQTLIYKDALMSEHTHTPLINPAPYHVKQSHGDHQFGPLLVFRENLLVTYSSDIVYVLNPATITVVATVADLRKVQDVAVNKDEIFILEGERSLIRVAYTPETTATLVQAENELGVPTNQDATNTTEALIAIVGSDQVQAMLADKTVSKKTTWEHVAAEMKKRGFIVGENAGEKCKREWNDIVSDYLNCHWTEACKVEADVPLYYDTLKEILNKKSVVLNSSDSSDEESTSDYTAETVQRKRKRTDYFSDVHNKFNRLPKQICQKDDSSSSELSPSDVTYSSDSNDNEAFETFKMLSETCTVNASTADDSKVSKSSSSREPNNEEVILVYPEGTTFSVDYRFLNDFMSSVDNVDTEEFVTVYPDDTENVTTSSARNHFIDHSYTEQISMEAVKPPNQSFVCSKKQGDLNIKPSSSDLEAHTKKSASATKKNLKSNKNLATIVVSPKPNQPARPIPTAGEAMMSLVLRLHEEEKRKEKARMRRREARISNLETMLEKQKTTQQDLLNKVLLVLNELN